MALKICNNLLKNYQRLSVIKCRELSQYYPIDEVLFGLNEEQQQVSCF